MAGGRYSSRLGGYCNRLGVFIGYYTILEYFDVPLSR